MGERDPLEEMREREKKKVSWSEPWGFDPVELCLKPCSALSLVRGDGGSGGTRLPGATGGGPGLCCFGGGRTGSVGRSGSGPWWRGSLGWRDDMFRGYRVTSAAFLLGRSVDDVIKGSL